jgi:uncharacterized membrane protein YebE (DUF533 family)
MAANDNRIDIRRGRSYVRDMNIEDLLGAVTQSGLRSRTAGDRLGKSMGGWASSQGSSGAPGGRLGEILDEAGRLVGGNRNLAVGGLGALAGALLGGGRGLGGALRGGMGGGVKALLGAMAYQALKNRAGQTSRVPLGLAAPQSEAEKAELASNAELVLRAMINAAKADGRVDETEIRRILGKVQESGADAQALEHLSAELKKPMETEALVAAVLRLAAGHRSGHPAGDAVPPRPGRRAGPGAGAHPAHPPGARATVVLRRGPSRPSGSPADGPPADGCPAGGPPAGGPG